MPHPRARVLIRGTSLFLRGHRGTIICSLYSKDNYVNVAIGGQGPSLSICLVRGCPTTLSCLHGGTELCGFPGRGVVRYSILSNYPSLPGTSLVVSGPPCVGSRRLPSLRERIKFRPGATLSNNGSKLVFCETVYSE